MVLKSVTATEILLEARLFKNNMNNNTKKIKFLNMTYLSIINLYFCDIRIDTNCFENSDSCCNFVSS